MVATQPPPPAPAPQTPPAQPPSKPSRRAKTPTVLQMEAVECGAAALGIILAHYGRIVALEELREACGVSRNGSKASNMLKGARRYGLVAKGFRREPDDLRSMPTPMIIHWDFNHFLVVEGFGKDKVYLNDPAVGRREVTLDEFNRSFTGVVMTFEPGPEFQKGGKHPSLFGALRSRLRGCERAVWFIILASLALVVPNLAVPVFTQVFIDAYLIRGDTGLLLPLLLGLLLAAGMRAFLTWLQQAVLLRLETKVALTTSSRFFWHVLRLPMTFYTQRQSGEIGNRVGLNDKVAQLLSGELATTALNLAIIGFYLVVMIYYDLLLTGIGVAIAALNFVVLRSVSQRRVDGNRRLLQERSKLQATSVGGLQVIETMKATGAESDFFARWGGYQAAVANAERDIGVSSQVLTTIPPLLNSLNTVVILTVGGLRVMDGQLTVGELVAFQVLMASFLKPVSDLVGLGGQLQEVEGNMNRLDDVLRYPRDPSLDGAVPPADTEAGRRAARMTTLSGQIEFQDITFGYSQLDPPLIEGFNLTLKPGDRVALVGGTGSGKSTIARLVGGLFQPWSGRILLDGVPREQIPAHVLTNDIAMVDQEIFLFEGTVRENITMWDSTIPETEVVRAAIDAAIHDDIVARPEGYDSRVEEGGYNFSGGQRQRLEIARALAVSPSILVLDEATSALDPITEQKIDDQLRRRGCTCLIIAHRLSTIRDADEIIVMEEGKVVERGTHTELSRKRDGAYARLIRSEAMASEQSKAASLLEKLL